MDYDEILDEISNLQGTSAFRRGHRFEDLIGAMIRNTRGLRPKLREVGPRGEIDIAIHCDEPWSQIFGPITLAECKNLKEKVGLSIVNEFRGKTETLPWTKAVIMFSMSGYSRQAIERIRIKKPPMLLFSRKEIFSILEGRKTLRECVEDHMMEY